MSTFIVGVVLAGGRSRRMGGGHKALLPLDQHTSVLDRIVRRAAPQVNALVLSANEREPFQRVGLPIVPDTIPQHPGPLAGILSAMEWARRERSDCEWVMSFPGDTPFFPMDAVERLLAAGHGANASPDKASLVAAASYGQRHYVFALWSLRLREELQRQLEEERNFRVWEFHRRHNALYVDFSGDDQTDPFFNINTPQDFQRAQALAAHFLAEY